MIPSVISPEVKSNAERKIFDWFKSAPGTDNWIVLHSLGIATHNKVIFGEIDFLVLAPQLGIFALEVKGGDVGRRGGVWTFTNRYGQTNSKVRGPFEQAKDGVFSVVAALKERVDDKHRHLKNVMFGFGVMFPDIEYDVNDIEYHQWQVFDKRDAKNVRQFIGRLARESRNRWTSVFGDFNESKIPDAEDVRYMASIFRGDFDCAVSMKVKIEQAKEELLKLTKEQYRCLDQLEDNPRCLIQGPAGTGKTLLALEEAKRCAANGEKVGFFCFNSNLAEWLKEYFKNMPEGVRPAYVGTLHKFMYQVSKDAGMLPSYDRDDSNYYRKILPEVAALAVMELELQFDVIVVDEAQDLIFDEYIDVFNYSLKKGIERGRWSFFGDFSMQAIYSDGISGKGMVEKLSNITSFIRFKLNTNCRNTKPICKEIETITGFVPPNDLWTKVEGLPVQYITWTTKENQRKRLEQILEHLKKTNVEPQDITILSPRRREESVVSLLEDWKIVDYRVSETSDITFSTIQGYKGLENTVIIMTDISSLSDEKLMYVGLSRARLLLMVLESEDAKREYDSLWIRRMF